MIQLGSFDAGVSAGACAEYKKRVEETTRVSISEIAEGSDKLVFKPCTPDSTQPMKVAEVQQALKAAGFFPGGKVDGICGYRTLSAMRLFQEYVRSCEKLPCLPDGRFGPTSQKHLKRWIDTGATTRWKPTAEYTDWLALLEKVKQKYTASPNRMLQLVAAFSAPTDTRPVPRWDFAAEGNIHMVGIRRNEFSGKFDDVFVLLIKGLVFKFQGSTEPGASENAAGAPFLVQGQHDYHFGWHQKTFLALRPQRLDAGVLVVRSKRDLRLDDADLNNGLEANGTINIHWGGKGMKFDVKNWSEGCQVINGTLYVNELGELIDCSSFAALNNAEIAANPSKTRSAYNVLLDLVSAFGSDLPGNTVKYTLLTEQDMELSPALNQSIADTRAKVGQLL